MKVRRADRPHAQVPGRQSSLVSPAGVQREASPQQQDGRDGDEGPNLGSTIQPNRRSSYFKIIGFCRRHQHL
jgi:hypothetical protein